MAAALRGFRAALLDLFATPPDCPNEVYFHGDLDRLGVAELREEARRVRGRLLLTPSAERNRWPGWWFSERVERISALLR